MAIITHMCPHRATDYGGLRIVAATLISTPSTPPRWAAHLECPKCKMPSCATLKLLAAARPWENFATFQGDFLDAGSAIEKFWPDAPKPLIPELLPPDVARIYLQAERNFPTTGNEEAAGTMYGKALDIGLKKNRSDADRNARQKDQTAIRGWEADDRPSRMVWPYPRYSQ
jgi:hypothetical protein